MNPNQSRLDLEPYFSQVRELIREGQTNASIAQTLQTTSHSVRRFRKRHGLGVPAQSTKKGVKAGVQFFEDGSAQVTGDAVVIDRQRDRDMNDPDQIMLQHGFDPLKWKLEGAKLNRWDGPVGQGNVVTYHQVTLRVQPRIEATIVPVRSDGWVAPKRVKRSGLYQGEIQKVAVFGDPQAPYYDPDLLRCTQAWLEKNKPDVVVHLGDTVDLPGEVSRHRNNPYNDASLMECLQSGYDWLRAIVQAHEGARHIKLPGNHDERIQNYIIDKAPALLGLSQVDNASESPVSPVYGLSHLMRLDELGIEFVDPQGPYDQAQIQLSKHLAVRHGWIARNGSGVSALASLDKLGYSIIVGHVHRQGIVHKTTHDIDGKPTVLAGVEAGCMCLVDPDGIKTGRKFPTYAVNPDWQQGFCSVTIFPDGKFSVDLATFVNDRLFYRDEQYG